MFLDEDQDLTLEEFWKKQNDDTKKLFDGHMNVFKNAVLKQWLRDQGAGIFDADDSNDSWNKNNQVLKDMGITGEAYECEWTKLKKERERKLEKILWNIKVFCLIIVCVVFCAIFLQVQDKFPSRHVVLQVAITVVITACITYGGPSLFYWIMKGMFSG